MRRARGKAMSTPIMLVMAAVVLMVTGAFLVAMLQKPVTVVSRTAGDVTPLLETTTCDIKCFDCCNRKNPDACGTVYDPATEDCDCSPFC